MPTSTDLVTDLPADFEVFGQAVDTDFVDLLGGTTGQVLSKTSAIDLDFTWINNDTGDITGVTAGTGITGGGTSGTVTVTNDMATTITAAGDIVVGTGSGTYDNLPIGTTAQVLTADTTVSPYKVKWATPSASGFTMASFTPTFTNLTLGNGTVVAYSGYSGDVAIVQIQVTFGSTSSTSGNVTFNGLPYTAKTTITDSNTNWTATTATARFSNASYDYAGSASVGGTSARVWSFSPPNPPAFMANGSMGAGASPINWTTGAVVQFSAIYWKA